MKKLIIIAICLLGAIAVNAQAYFSCTHRTFYRWNNKTESFDYLNDYDENSLFEINKEGTMFTHTTPTLSSSYYMKDNAFDEKTGQFSCNVLSDVGNEYYYVFDAKKEEVRVLSGQDNEIILLIFTVKKCGRPNKLLQNQDDNYRIQMFREELENAMLNNAKNNNIGTKPYEVVMMLETTMLQRYLA